MVSVSNDLEGMQAEHIDLQFPDEINSGNLGFRVRVRVMRTVRNEVGKVRQPHPTSPRYGPHQSAVTSVLG